ncbi:ferritin-like domain-containing protein [Arcobacter vandammei]|uniref:ferritin-like domain-containing protein n=1 Tax=Arcobacter vandammei TaxID=2782243 RepID=UPI0018DF6069|nr:ferritin-like domain-containing protein [Arcobacter vandammei]
MDYFSNLEAILLENSPKNKFEMFNKLYKNFLNNNISFDNNYIAPILISPSYSTFLNIVKPTALPEIKNFKSIEGKKYLVHTILHIEYSAIDLALDAALRYQNMPLKYYQDWLEVASDEIRHFLMLEELIKELGGFYGEFDVHKNLFEAMQQTPDFISRMACVPRYLEANGLDQNPKIMQKLNSNRDSFNTKFIKALGVILEEEVEHVRKGDFWFKTECDRLGLNYEETYFEAIERVFPGSTKRKMDLNFMARKEAGFSCDELKFLSKKEDCF